MDKGTIEERLRQMGMTNQQINSKSCQNAIGASLPADLFNQIKYTQKRVEEIASDAEEKLTKISKSYSLVNQKIDNLMNSFAVEINDMKNMDEKALSAFTLYASLIKIGKKTIEEMYKNSFGLRSDNDDHINKMLESIGYIVYAYLGGQARRIYENE